MVFGRKGHFEYPGIGICTAADRHLRPQLHKSRLYQGFLGHKKTIAVTDNCINHCNSYVVEPND